MHTPTQGNILPDHVRYPGMFQLADPEFGRGRDIELLLGAENSAKILTGTRCDFMDKPSLFESRFGWIVMGAMKQNKEKGVEFSVMACNQECCELDQALKKWWAVEELSGDQELTAEEAECEKHFEETVERNLDGSFVVRLPVKSEDIRDQGSKKIAFQRFYQLERRFLGDNEMREVYVQFMKQYEELGHMKLMTTTEVIAERDRCWYLPHHAIHSQRTGTGGKFRVVFDASAKNKQGISLNDRLLIGPRIQDELVDLLLRFRMFRVAITADIEKMYRQIWMNERDTHLQRILWRESIHQPVREYALQTVTYGIASAPYLATKCLQRLAKENEVKYPKASEVLKKDFYMDDLLSGANSIEEAQKLQRELVELLHMGRFKLRKWASNELRVLTEIPVECRRLTPEQEWHEKVIIKTLGMYWNIRADVFNFGVENMSTSDKITKRVMLSKMCKTFDPMGWLSPVTIRLKVLLQELWRKKIEWDDVVPVEIARDWKNIGEELLEIEEIQIPRYVSGVDRGKCQLIAFADASKTAYAACVYLRSRDDQGSWQMSLLAAKTRVAPVKEISLPRLELCAADLLAKLYQVVYRNIAQYVEESIAFTDSKVVLAWLEADPYKWKTFVANRVARIVTIIPRENWYYIKSQENPADKATRGLKVKELKHMKLWWEGPVAMKREEWLDILKKGKVINETQEEVRIVSCISTEKEENKLLERFSSWNKLRRVMAYCLRFINNSRRTKAQRNYGGLSCQELSKAMRVIYILVQKESYELERRSLSQSRGITYKSKLAQLSVFLDDDGIIRVGGRLQEAKGIMFEQKHQIVLPKHHRVTDLIVRYYHEKGFHAGPQLLQAVLRERYWIIGMRDVTRKCVRKCVVCVKNKANVNRQLMGNLPEARVSHSKPFSNCGVDFAGPFTLRVMKCPRGRKQYKGYMALFVCFATRAVHLELVSDLSTPAFIAALKRFVARRGRCSDIYSDCGTNFVGTNKELKEFQKMIASNEFNSEIRAIMAEEEIRWHFNSPAAPHMGGLWEAGIKSVKHHLRRIVGETVLNFEEFYTILTQIEACLNSRPLTPCSSDPTDLSVLTPGHFLIGEAMTALPGKDYSIEKMSLTNRWQLCQQIIQHIWKRWSSEVISRLQQRSKWRKIQDNVKEGDMVVIRTSNYPPTRWLLGRIQKTYPGKDDLVRVVDIRTRQGIVRRPIGKIAKLPVDEG